MLIALPSVNPDILDPRITYTSVKQWKEAAYRIMAENFITNFDKYTDTPPAVAKLIIVGYKM
jgi:phosphoenolpyruvate carboxykinase (ATP)